MKKSAIFIVVKYFFFYLHPNYRNSCLLSSLLLQSGPRSKLTHKTFRKLIRIQEPTKITSTGAQHCKDEPVAPSLHIKPKEPKSFVTPSPGAYNPDSADKDVKASAPKYSFGIKPKTNKGKEVPAPNAYTMSKSKVAPSYSLASRPKDAKKYITPAPGAYESADINQYKDKAPLFSLATRYNIPSDVAMKPGPGAYLPEKVIVRRPPHYAFGIKHSPFLGKLKADV